MKKARLLFHDQDYSVDLANPLDLSLGIRRNKNVNAFYLPDPQFVTVEAGEFVGDVEQGGSCNVENITISPHGNGTHTECIGHISQEKHMLSSCLTHYHFMARLITLNLTVNDNNDRYINDAELSKAIEDQEPGVEALIIRTIPNDPDKALKIYSGKRPAYLSKKGAKLIAEKDFNHLLVDLPSLDHEQDGDLPAHHTFFGYPDQPQIHKTVTELIYAPNEIADGFYLLNLQALNLESDASPSRPVLYKIHEI